MKPAAERKAPDPDSLSATGSRAEACEVGTARRFDIRDLEHPASRSRITGTLHLRPPHVAAGA